MWKANLEARKKEALEVYKKARKDTLISFDGKKFDDEKFKIFAEAKRNCKLLGVRI